MRSIHVLGAIALVVVLNLCALYAYRRYTRKKVNEELQIHVNSAVSQYFKLSGQDTSRDF
jgi:cbb3-type cytochrome oxidase subunit 3